jgi:flagellar protein FlaJ
MLYRFIPPRYRNWVRKMIELSGMKTKPEKYIARSLIMSIAIAGLVSLFTGAYMVYVFVGVFCGMFFLLNAWLILAVDRRSNFVENVLPDALELTAANIRSGFIPSKALLLAARSEFGPLAEAIRRSGKEIMTGKSLADGLNQIPRYIKSDILERAVKLISEGSRSGGQLVALLEENAIDIRRKQAIKKEVKANIIMYGIFIVFAGVLGAPVLYALSLYLITTLTAFSSAGTIPESFSSNVPFFKFGITVSPDFLMLFSVTSIIITTFFSGIIIGLIDTGKEKGGIKYVPIFMIIALLVFFGASMFISSMFSGFLPS